VRKKFTQCTNTAAGKLGNCENRDAKNNNNTIKLESNKIGKSNNAEYIVGYQFERFFKNAGWFKGKVTSVVLFLIEAIEHGIPLHSLLQRNLIAAHLCLRFVKLASNLFAGLVEEGFPMERLNALPKVGCLSATLKMVMCFDIHGNKLRI